MPGSCAGVQAGAGQTFLHIVQKKSRLNVATRRNFFGFRVSLRRSGSGKSPAKTLFYRTSYLYYEGSNICRSCCAVAVGDTYLKYITWAVSSTTRCGYAQASPQHVHRGGASGCSGPDHLGYMTQKWFVNYQWLARRLWMISWNAWISSSRICLGMFCHWFVCMHHTLNMLPHQIAQKPHRISSCSSGY